MGSGYRHLRKEPSLPEQHISQSCPPIYLTTNTCGAHYAQLAIEKYTLRVRYLRRFKPLLSSCRCPISAKIFLVFTVRELKSPGSYQQCQPTSSLSPTHNAHLCLTTTSRSVASENCRDVYQESHARLEPAERTQASKLQSPSPQELV